MRSRSPTDSTTFAQQEPSIALNPLNHLNVVAASKDERSAPGPGTETKEVWIETSTDGGLTWPVQTHIPMPDTTKPQQSDPVVTFSDNNTVYVTIIGLSIWGCEVLRRECIREFPDEPPGERTAQMRARVSGAMRRTGGRTGELERLGRLRDSGVLTEEEFAAQKAALMGDGPTPVT